MSASLAAWIRLMSLIRKEFVVMLMDKGTRKILILPIIIQSILFGYGATFNLERVPYIIFQDSFDATAVSLVHQINNNKTFELVRACHDEQCFNDSLNHGDALLGIYIASDFSRNRTVFVATDARNTSSANTALGYVQTIVSDLNSQRRQQSAISGGIHLDYRYFYNPNNYTRFSIMTGMILALSMIQVLLLSSLSVSREREEGTFDMMLMAPLTPVEILIGKAFPPTIIAVSQGLGLFLICILWFNIPFQGNFLALVTVMSVFSVCIVGIGLAVSALTDTSQQSVVISFTILLPTIILSGMITPMSAMPEMMQYVSMINPFYYGLEALRRIYLEGQTLMQVFHLLLPLFAIGAVTLSTAVHLFRGKLG